MGSTPGPCSEGDQSDDYEWRWESSHAEWVPQWTPDGSHIVFGHAGRIYVVPAAGSDLKSLSGSFEPAGVYTDTKKLDFSPSISPDGSRVAFTTLRWARGSLYDQKYEIAIQDIDGSDRKRLTKNDWDDVSPAWSPDGSRIAFVSDRASGFRVFVMDADGSDEHGVAPHVHAQTAPPVWSPDGSRVAFVGRGFERGTHIFREAIYIASPDGSGLRKVEWYEGKDYARKPREGYWASGEPEADVGGFRWSPDGRLIAFVGRFYGYDDGLYVANADGSNVREIFNLATRRVPDQLHPRPVRRFAWSSDSSTIGFEFSIYSYDNDGYSTRYWYTVTADGSAPPIAATEAGLRASPGWYGTLASPTTGRIAIYTADRGPNASPRVRSWILSTIAWDGSDERVLVRISDGRLVPAVPPRTDAAEDSKRCSSNKVVLNAGRTPDLWKTAAYSSPSGTPWQATRSSTGLQSPQSTSGRALR